MLNRWRTLSLQLNVQVIDINDNVPTFVYPESSKRYGKNTYYGAVAGDEKIGSTVLQIKAEDLDGGKLGDVRYGYPIKSLRIHGFAGKPMQTLDRVFWFIDTHTPTYYTDNRKNPVYVL